MEVLNPRSALLSNYEVLTLLRELESDHLARTKTALRIKKEEDLAGTSTAKNQHPAEDVCENLRTIEVEAIQYLSADYQPTASQSEAGIAGLTRSLSGFDLTKAEKLQIVNLAPTETVELYVIVEELEDRFGDRVEGMLDTVRSSLANYSNSVQQSGGRAIEEVSQEYQVVYSNSHNDEYFDEEGTWDYAANEIVFDDSGEGAGVEGDLDIEDD